MDGWMVGQRLIDGQTDGWMVGWTGMWDDTWMSNKIFYSFIHPTSTKPDIQQAFSKCRPDA